MGGGTISSEAPLFRAAFAAVPAADIAAALRCDGVSFHPSALDRECVDRITREIGPDGVTINRNGLATVGFGRQFFLTQVLGKSKTAYDLITSNRILDVAEALLGPRIRLTAKRYYTTLDGARMQWHRDNKSAANLSERREGVLCIFYLTDVGEGGLQYVRDSHRIEPDRESPDFDDGEVAARWGDRIETLRGPAGSCVFLRLQTIHRAEPIQTAGGPRSSLLAQIDAEPAVGEAVLLNTSFVGELDERRRHFLGFGNRETKPDFPVTGVSTLDVSAARATFEALAAHPTVTGDLRAAAPLTARARLRRALARILRPRVRTG